MIAPDMRLYDYSVFSIVEDAYGQPTEETQEGKIKMAIYLTNEVLDDNTLYSGAQYAALTLDANITDAYVIHYNEHKLKVLYVAPQGRYKKVYLARM
jgi:hypothetical protein